jgi:hypothetical protein
MLRMLLPTIGRCCLCAALLASLYFCARAWIE